MKTDSNGFVLLVLFIVVVLVLATDGACASEDDYFFARVGLGKNVALFSSHEWVDQGQLGGSIGFGYRHQISGNWHGELSYTHYSQPLAGGPVHPDQYEYTLDAFYYSLEYQWR